MKRVSLVPFEDIIQRKSPFKEFLFTGKSSNDQIQFYVFYSVVEFSGE